MDPYNDDICDGLSDRVTILSMMVLVMSMISVSVMVFDIGYCNCILMWDSRSIGDSV